MEVEEEREPVNFEDQTFLIRGQEHTLIHPWSLLEHEVLERKLEREENISIKTLEWETHCPRTVFEVKTLETDLKNGGMRLNREIWRLTEINNPLGRFAPSARTDSTFPLFF